MHGGLGRSPLPDSTEWVPLSSPHLPFPLRSLHEKLPCLTDRINIHTNGYRHGNCPWKCKFPQQWNWLSMKKNDCLCGKEIGGTKKKNKKKRSIGFSFTPNTHKTECSSTLNTCKTYRAQSYVAIARLCHVMMNKVTCCYCCRLATGLNTAILTRFCTVTVAG